MSTVQATISAFTTNPDPIHFLDSPTPAMVTASLQPLIPATRPSPSPSPPSLGRKTSLLDLKDWVVDDGAFRLPSTRMGISQLKSANSIKGRPQERPGNPITVTSSVPLIDLHSPLKPKPKPKPKPTNLAGIPTQAATNNNKQSPPQLPPRKPSHTSLKTAAASSSQGPPLNFLYPPRRQDSLTVDQRLEPYSKSSSHAQSSSISSFHSVSLSSDTSDTSRPGSVSNFIATFPIERENSASSANSGVNDIDSVSLTESYEEVSTSSLASPATEEKIEWQYATRKPPKLPERPSQLKRGPSKATTCSEHSSPVIQPSLSRHSSVSTLNNAAPPYSPYTPRRAAPPAPPRSRSSDRSSILSSQSFSSHSSHSYQQPPPLPGGPTAMFKTKRPTPVPLAARKRYEVVFIKNILQQRQAHKAKENEKPSPGLLSPPSEVARNRRAAGWRGLSVDLIVDPEASTTDTPTPRSQRDEGTADELVDGHDELEGAIVKLVWKKSGLESTRLAEIWNECDSAGQGSLNLDGFVKGMWRIDEELRRTQAQMLKLTSTNTLGLYRHQSVRSSTAPAPVPVGVAPPRLPPRYKEILQ